MNGDKRNAFILCALLTACSDARAPTDRRAQAETVAAGVDSPPAERGPSCPPLEEPVEDADREALDRLGVPRALYPDGVPECGAPGAEAPEDGARGDAAPEVGATGAEAPKGAASAGAAAAAKQELPVDKTQRSCAIKGFADLHTHMFAELAWSGFISGRVDDLSSASPATFAQAVPRCSGGFDHATIKPGYGVLGLGIVSEGLTAVGGFTAFTGVGGVSAGDTGLHLFRRNGYDTRMCAGVCTGPSTCALHRSQAACAVADPGFCKDDIPGNLSLSALASCNTRTDRAACEGSGYCGAVNSILWSVADDLSPCSAQWPSCDSGDLCLKRNPFISLACNDLSQSECQRHGAECNWTASCHYRTGMLECNDLSQSECARYPQCYWNGSQGVCRSDIWSGPLECNDLNDIDCQSHSDECRLDQGCVHPPGAPSLTCGDLSPAECANHYGDGGCGLRDCREVQCHWEDAGSCQWQALWPPSCGQHFKDWPAWDTPTHQQHYWGWLKDAHERGLQLVSASILEVHPLSKLFPTYHQTPYEVITAQLVAANEFARKHASWVGIARSSTEARDLIQQGKLAMVLTLEAQFPFCKKEPCGAGLDETDWTRINATLDEYQALGLRGFQIVGHFDNLHAGVGIYQQAIHSMQWLYEEMSRDGVITELEFLAALGGSSLSTVAQQVDSVLNLFFAPGAMVPGVFPAVGFHSLNDLHALGAVLGRITGTRCVERGTNTPMDCGVCLRDKEDCSNEIGLTPLGEQLVRELKARKMLIDIAHMGDRGIRDLDDLLSREPGGSTYPYYVSHGDPREALTEDGEKGPHQEKPSSVDTLTRVKNHGGMFGQRTGADHMKDDPGTMVPNDCDGSSKSFAQALSYLTDKGVDVGFAFDMNGMTQQSVPRFTGNTARGRKAACLGSKLQQLVQSGPVADDPATPYTDEADLNTKGLGHIGLAGAYVEELRGLGLEARHLDNLLCSADSFVEMWKRAER